MARVEILPLSLVSYCVLREEISPCNTQHAIRKVGG